MKKAEVEAVLWQKIAVTVDGETAHILAKHYAKAKHKNLVDFGYDDLKHETVREKLAKILKGEPDQDVISLMIQSDKVTVI